MNNRRRRAYDFTDSLNNFRQTFIEDQTVSQYSEDSLDNGCAKTKQHENNNYPRNKTRTGSIILAGHLASEPSVSSSDSYENGCKDRQAVLKDINISDETSYMSLKPDLNKCINLFHNDCLSKEICTSGELSSSIAISIPEIKVNRSVHVSRSKSKTVEVQCNLSKDYPRSVSLISVRNTSCPCNEIRRSKSCMTFNHKIDNNNDVKTDPSFSKAATTTNNQEIQIVVSPCKSLLISSTLANKKNNSHSTKEDQKYDSISSEKSSKEDYNPCELKALLNSLGDQKLWKEEGTHKCLLRRMSTNFYDSPRNFTEQLLTIIEESVINSDVCGSMEYPEVSLCRLTEELRKMCKFIEDETAPEWPRSPNMSTPSGRKNSKGGQNSKLDSSRKSVDAVTTPENLCVVMPIQCNMKSPKKKCNNMPKISAQSPKLHGSPNSTSTFESLEAFCKILYPNEYKIPVGEKHISQSPLRDMKHILLRCGNQMASLDNSPNVCEQLKKTEISIVTHKPDTVPETQNSQYKLSHEKRSETNLNSISDALKCKQQAESIKPYEMIDPDDLENTLKYELAKKRKRCLDTAKVMLEIEASSELIPSGITEAQQSSYSSNAIVESSNIKNDSKFMETLMTVKNYQNYLEEYKTLINALPQTESNTSHSSDEKDTRLKKVNKARLEIPKSPVTKKNTPSAKHCSSKNTVVSKSRLFVTPGKTPVKRVCNSKRTYFLDNVITETNKQKKRDISPHEKNVYRQIGSYDHVISPVGMYIRSTNPSLVKNVQSKTDEMLLTPKKKQITSSTNSKPMMKFRLSPNKLQEKMTETAVKDENIADNFLHPKVQYKLPSHVRTVKENQKVGNRINELLRTTRDKVVIRHEARVKSVKADCLESPEIHYTSAEESVHIEQTARKTHFSRVK